MESPLALGTRCASRSLWRWNETGTRPRIWPLLIFFCWTWLVRSISKSIVRWPGPTEAHHIEKRFLQGYRTPNSRIGYVFSECSNVFGNVFKTTLRRLTLQLVHDISDEQSRHWGREGRRPKDWCRFQLELRDELSRFVELDRPFTLLHFRYS